MDMSPFAFSNDLLSEISSELLTFTPDLENISSGDNMAVNNMAGFSDDIVNGIVGDTALTDSALLEYVSPTDISLHSSLLTTPQPTPDYCVSLANSKIDDLEEFLTPLVSPAVTPSYSEVFHFHDSTNENYFTPLSSPALPPDPMKQMADNTLLYQQLQQIESKQQQLREKMAMSPVSFKSPHLKLTNPPSPLPWQLNNGSINSIPSLPKKKHSLRQKIALASPQLKASSQQQQHLPATPASLMNISTHQHTLPPSTSSSSISNTITIQYNNNDNSNNNNNAINNYNINDSTNSSSTIINSETPIHPTATVEEPARKKSKLISPTVTASPRTLKPLISPFLQPDSRISLAESETSLASKSNYQNLLEGKAKSLGMHFATNIQSGVENRRSAHKVAEQRRRDTLKQSFDHLREEIIDVIVLDTLAEKTDLTEKEVREEKEKEVKLMSKVLLLQQSYEYIIRLKKENKIKDDKVERMQLEINELRKMMSKDEVS